MTTPLDSSEVYPPVESRTLLPNPGSEAELKQAGEELLRSFKVPFGNDDDRAWCYMSIDKFVSLVVSGSAYFRRLDLLVDEFEGALSKVGHEAQVAELIRAATEHNLVPEGVDPYEVAYLSTGSMDALVRASIYTNYWTRNPHESWAMWKNFGQNGVAIGSTIGRLRDAFLADAPLGEPGRVFIGEVEYIDHETDDMTWTLPFLYKHQMFSWEREIRVGVFHYPREHSVVSFNADHPKFLYLPVNLDVLIDQVVVAPGSGEEFRTCVQTLLGQNELAGKHVHLSAADRIPEYRRIHLMNRQTLLDTGKEIPIHMVDLEP